MGGNSRLSLKGKKGGEGEAQADRRKSYCFGEPSAGRGENPGAGRGRWSFLLQEGEEKGGGYGGRLGRGCGIRREADANERRETRRKGELAVHERGSGTFNSLADL